MRKTRLKPHWPGRTIWPLPVTGLVCGWRGGLLCGRSCWDSNAGQGHWAGVDSLLGCLVFIWLPLWGLTHIGCCGDWMLLGLGTSVHLAWAWAVSVGFSGPRPPSPCQDFPGSRGHWAGSTAAAKTNQPP